jgi:hypothetical protein
MSPQARAALRAAKAHLDPQELYPRPVSLRGVTIHSVPWFFRLPFMRRFVGYATYQTILLKRPLAEVSPALVAHELCHVWQMQHHPLKMPLSYLRGYDDNRYELEARRAASGA